jgi:ribosomal protein S4
MRNLSLVGVCVKRIGMVSSITGQSRQMVEHYARMVNQKKLAASVVLKWEASGGTEPERNL